MHSLDSSPDKQQQQQQHQQLLPRLLSGSGKKGGPSPWRLGRRGTGGGGASEEGGKGDRPAGTIPAAAAPSSSSAPDLDTLLLHQSSPIRRPLLNRGGGSSSDPAPAARAACAAFRTLLALCGDAAPAGTPPLAGPARLEAAHGLVTAALADPGLRDETYMQALKQTRGNPSRGSAARAWGVLAALASAVPPGPDFAVLVAEYVHAAASAKQGEGEVEEEQQGVHGERSPLPPTRALARRAWAALKRSTRAGPRAHPPSLADIAAALDGTPLTTSVTFLDGGAADIAFEPSASVLDAVEAAAAAVGLAHHTTFTLFAVRPSPPGAEPREVGGGAPEGEVHVPLVDAAYLADALADAAAAAGAHHHHPSSAPPRLLFKKRLFREGDAAAAAADPVFVSLAYTQARADYLAGLYPVARGDAAQLGAWQAVAAEAEAAAAAAVARARGGRATPHRGPPLDGGDAGADAAALRACVPPALWSMYEPAEWLADTRPRAAAAAAKAAEEAEKEEAAMADEEEREDAPSPSSSSIPPPVATAARRAFLRLIRALPYGDALFFPITFNAADHAAPGGGSDGSPPASASTLSPSPLASLFPSRMLLGVNRRGLHFFRRHAPRQYLHSVPLRDVAQFGATAAAAFFKLRLAGGGGGEGEEGGGGGAAAAAPSGPLHLLQFGTAAGEDVCLALQTHIDDVVRRRAAAAAAQAAEAAAAAVASRAAQAAAAAAGPALEEVRPGPAGNSRRSSSSSATPPPRSPAAARRLAALEAERDAALARAAAAEAALAGGGHAGPAPSHRSPHPPSSSPSSSDIPALRAAVDAAAAEAASARARIAALEAALAAETVARKRAVNAAAAAAGRVRVIARVRPSLGPGGAALGPGAPPPPPCALSFPDALTLAHGPLKGSGGGSGSSAKGTPLAPVKSFDFDAVLPPSASQADVWAAVDGDAMVRAALDGDNVCLLAYGQTGAGKTHSVWGEPGDARRAGLAPRAGAALFAALGAAAGSGGKVRAAVSATVLELYCDDLHDLLAGGGGGGASPVARGGRGGCGAAASSTSSPSLEIKRDPGTGAVSVPGAVAAPVPSATALEALLSSAVARRATAPTALNAASSRSHLVMSLSLDVTDGTTGRCTAGKLTFVDLAGSERIKRSGSEAGQALAEATAVNRSLSALGDVAAALAEGASHIPYRNSKLTMLLADCLGGSARAALLLAASPDPSDLPETGRALEYGSRVRTITNAPARAAWSAEAARLRREVEAWKARYAAVVGAGAGVGLAAVEDVRGGGPPPLMNGGGQQQR